MKKLLFIPALLLTLATIAQKVIVVNPNCNLTVKAGDSALLQALVTTSDGFSSLVFTPVSGPTTAVLGTPRVDWSTGLQAKVSVPVKGLSIGTYAFMATAKSTSGSIMTAPDTVFVVAAPPPPVPRKIKTVVFNLVNGLWVPTVTYDDGSTQ